MEELCQPDDALKCSRWHRKLQDKTAHEGVSPGAIAFAATMVRDQFNTATISVIGANKRLGMQKLSRALAKVRKLSGILRRAMLLALLVTCWP
jgi:hypothetical protein